MREDGFEDLIKKVKRFFEKKKNIKLTRAELETIVRALGRSNEAVLSLSPNHPNEFQEMLNYLSQYQDSYQDSAMIEKKKQRIVKFLTQRGLKCHITRKC